MPPGQHGVSRKASTLATAATLALAATLLAACSCTSGSNDDDATESDDGTTAPSQTTATTLSVEDEVEAAYLAYWTMATRLAGAPNPDDPEITQRASGTARSNLIDGLTTLQSSNQRSEFGEQYGHEVLSVEPAADGTAVVEDCTVDDSRIIRADTGEVVVQGIGTQHLSVVMHHVDDLWVVDRIAELNAWEGAVSCIEPGGFSS